MERVLDLQRCLQETKYINLRQMNVLTSTQTWRQKRKTKTGARLVVLCAGASQNFPRCSLQNALLLQPTAIVFDNCIFLKILLDRCNTFVSSTFPFQIFFRPKSDHCLVSLNSRNISLLTLNWTVGFVVALCQTKPSWCLTKISKIVETFLSK